MEDIIRSLGMTNASTYHSKIYKELLGYNEKTINKDGSISYRWIETDYFIKNNCWHVAELGSIKNFHYEFQKCEIKNKTIDFHSVNAKINAEMKFIVYHKLFSTHWSFQSLFSTNKNHIHKAFKFLNKKYPNLSSILELNIKKINFEWIDWIKNEGIQTTYTSASGKVKKSRVCNFLNSIHEYLYIITDERVEWEKDIWDIRNLSKYGVAFNRSRSAYYLYFNTINNIALRNALKFYYKNKLLSKNNFTFDTSAAILSYLSAFLNFISTNEPTWQDLHLLSRRHIEDYIQYLNEYTVQNLIGKRSNPTRYINYALGVVQNFLAEIQLYEYSIAPKENTRRLIYPSDRPKLKKKPYDQIDYVPEHVLHQLMQHIHCISKEAQAVTLIMLYTGLRVSDVLQLKQDCLLRINEKFWIETDIEKTYVKGHRIPIDENIANIIAVLIDQSKKVSNADNNINQYIFCKYKGTRKGLPYSQRWIALTLNNLAAEKNIVDETGNLYRFNNHSFRHTYAIKMLNGGADILTVQELLAHASPEMTMRYAKLLDDTKRKSFDDAVKQGVFSFDIDGKLCGANSNEISRDVLDMLWTNHKLNAIDTPYGTCLQRSKGRCTFAKQPPCLTCDSGKPCKDLCVGAFEGDIKKYEILIQSTKALMEQAMLYQRDTMAEENQELLKLYEDIFRTVSEGNIVYSRIDRLMKQGDTNE